MVVLNRGVPILDATWLMMGVYFVIAILFVYFDRHMFFAKSSEI